MMQLIIERADLVEGLSKIQGAIPSRPALPILSNLYLESDGDALLITATDLTQSMRVSVRAKVLKAGVATVPARPFLQLVRQMTSPRLQLESVDGKVVVRGDGSQFSLLAMPVADFPAFPSYDNGFSLSLPSSELHDLLCRVASSSAHDDSRVILNGVLLELTPGRLTAVATNGKRLAKNTMVLAKEVQGRLGVVLPIRSVEEMIRMLSDGEHCEIYLSQEKGALVVGGAVLVTKLLQGAYPDYEQILAMQEQTAKITLHKEELASILRQVSLFTSDNAASVRFRFDGNELKLRASSQEIGDGNASMPIDYRGEALEIAFNPHYALDVLRFSKGETVEIELLDSYHQGVIRDQSEALFVLMPMRLTANV